MRHIKSNLTADDIQQIAEITTHAKLDAALGYLCKWATDSYARVQLYAADLKSPEIVACYWRGVDDTGRPDYVIGAVWHDAGEGHFGFHS